MNVVRLGDYTVRRMRDTFRIYPEDRHGEVHPVTADRVFVVFRHELSGADERDNTRMDGPP